MDISFYISIVFLAISCVANATLARKLYLEREKRKKGEQIRKTLGGELATVVRQYELETGKQWHWDF